MLNKMIFIVIVVAFGTITYLMGIYTPLALQLSIRSSLETFISTSPKNTEDKGEDTVKTEDTATTSEAKPKDANKPTPMSALDVVSPAPKGTEFGLKVLALPQGTDTSSLSKKLESIGFTGVDINVVDSNAAPWLIYAAGKFKTETDANNARDAVAQVLNIKSTLPVITLPKPPKKS